MPGPAFEPLRIPADFWHRDDVTEALRRRDIGRLFALIRQHLGASQFRIGMAVDLTQPAVSALITGPRKITDLEVFERIADRLNMPDHARLLLGLAPNTPITTPVPQPPSAALPPAPAQTVHATHPRTDQPSTVLEHLIRQYDLSYEEVAAKLNISARHLASRERDNDAELHELLHGYFARTALEPSGTLMARIEGVRRQFDRTLAASSITIDQVDSLDARSRDSARQCVFTPPVEMLCRLVLDLTEVHDLISRPPRPPLQEGLYRVAARLSALLADELTVLGEIRQSWSWHATACFAADQTSDIGLRAEVRALGALLPLYYGDPFDAVKMTRQAQDIGTDADSFVSALAPTYEALGHAQLAAVEDSEAALSIARDSVGSLGSGFQEESVFGSSERRWRFYEGKVLSYLGRSDQAWTAHEEALSLYPDDVVGDPALILFDRAISLVRDRQVNTGCQLAERSLFELPQEHRTDLFIRAARRVLTAVPDDQKTGAAAQHYREALRSLSCRVPTTK